MPRCSGPYLQVYTLLQNSQGLTLILNLGISFFSVSDILIAKTNIACKSKQKEYAQCCMIYSTHSIYQCQIPGTVNWCTGDSR